MRLQRRLKRRSMLPRPPGVCISTISTFSSSLLKQASSLQHTFFAAMQTRPLTKQIMPLSNLVIIDLGFNGIEEVPKQIQQFKFLEKLFLNNNPIQYVPIEISECSKLKVLDLSYTHVKYLPRDLCKLRKTLYLINLKACPLAGKVSLAYDAGLLNLFDYLQRKADRKKYREIVCKQLKEWVYPFKSEDEIQVMLQSVWDNMKDVETKDLKRLVRNLQNIFPLNFDDCDPYIIRQKLFSSKVTKNTGHTRTVAQPDKTAEQPQHY
eukprot:TRINITY_DN6390_c0_g1_i1.p1 TRINITY_DN6390_c0_g1~~TRINITY_DN6390_c0_g1_i1.p1  ORF type:complete len:265 (+),score=33.46 TRINITY_DN6390_c0_g1_i1:82-876(+)